MNHLSMDELSALLDGALSPPERREAADRHLASCAECRDALAELSAQDALFARSSAHDPGEAYFEQFAERVTAKIRQPAPAPLSWWERLLSPRSLALAGSAAAVITVAGLVWMQSRERVASSLRRDEITRYDQSAEPLRAPVPESKDDRMNGATPEQDRDGSESPQNAPAPASQDKKAFAASPSPAEPGPAKQAPMDRLDAREQRAEPPSASRMAEVQKSPGSDEIVVKERALPGATSAAPMAPAPQAPPATGAMKLERGRVRASADEARQSLPAPEMQSKSLAKSNEEAARGGAPSTLGLPDASEASVSVCGQVVDSEGRAVAGAQVTVVETGKGSVTGADGRYCVETPPGAKTISVMSLGFQRVRRTVAVVAGGEQAFDIRLAPVNVLPQALGITGSRSKGLPSAALNAGGQSPWPAAFLPQTTAADSLTDVAQRSFKALDFDRAGAAWESVSELLRDQVASSRALSRAAEMRFRAWKLGPNDARKSAARAAAQAYLDATPTAPVRDPVRGWLRELSR